MQIGEYYIDRPEIRFSPDLLRMIDKQHLAARAVPR